MEFRLRGNIALLTVLTLVVLLVSIGASLVISSTDYLISGRDFTERLSLDLMTRTCLEEGMYHLKTNKSYVGTFTYTEETNSCTIVIAQEGLDPNHKRIEINTLRGEYALDSTFYVDVSTKPYQITR